MYENARAIFLIIGRHSINGFLCCKTAEKGLKIKVSSVATWQSLVCEGVCFYFMANCDLKKFIIESGLYKRYASARKVSYLQSQGYEIELDNLNDFECFLSNEYGLDWFEIRNECERIGNSSRQRIKRLKKRINDLLEKGECLFLTLTFTDSLLDETDKKTRAKLVFEYLKSQSSDFIANIDFGMMNNREHYHAVICAKKVDYTAWHKNGAIKGKKVALKGGSCGNVARYIDKLSLHALKDTTYRSRLLYSHA